MFSALYLAADIDGAALGATLGITKRYRRSSPARCTA